MGVGEGIVRQVLVAQGGVCMGDARLLLPVIATFRKDEVRPLSHLSRRGIDECAAQLLEFMPRLLTLPPESFVLMIGRLFKPRPPPLSPAEFLTAGAWEFVACGVSKTNSGFQCLLLIQAALALRRRRWLRRLTCASRPACVPCLTRLAVGIV